MWKKKTHLPSITSWINSDSDFFSLGSLTFGEKAPSSTRSWLWEWECEWMDMAVAKGAKMKHNENNEGSTIRMIVNS